MSQLWTLLAGAISSLSIEVVEDSHIGLPIVLALQPARVISFPVVSLTRESTAPLELGTCACGPINRREPRASQSQWSETAGEGVPFIFKLVVAFAIGVHTCVTLCSRDYRIRRAGRIVARRFWVCRQPCSEVSPVGATTSTGREDPLPFLLTSAAPSCCMSFKMSETANLSANNETGSFELATSGKLHHHGETEEKEQDAGFAEVPWSLLRRNQWRQRGCFQPRHAEGGSPKGASNSQMKRPR